MAAEVKWIKLCTDIFSNRKIRQIEAMPEGDAIIVVWLKLLTLAGETNAGGMVWFSKSIPYTDQMLATAFNRPLTTVQLALRTFEHFGMIEIVDNFINISNWEKYQNVEGMEKVREQTRLRVAACRERKKLLQENSASDGETPCNATSNATVTQGNGTDIERELELESLSFNPSSYDSGLNDRRAEARHVVDAWNQIGVAPVKKVDFESSRGKMLLARLKEYGEAEVLKAVAKVGQSAFLRGQNNRNWTITFDWFVKPSNFLKVLEGQYDKGRTTAHNGGGRESTLDRLKRLTEEGAFDE